MAKNFVQPGKIVNLTAPNGGVTTGLGYLIGKLFVVALDTIAAALTFPGAVTGVFDLTKTSAQAWTEGQRIYWDNTNHRCDSDGTLGQLIGVCVLAAANPSATGRVRLNGGVPAAATGPEAAITDLTDNSGGAAADGTIGVVTAPAALTDSTGGTPATTFAAITAPGANATTSLSADMLAVKNALAQTVASQNADRTAIIALTDAVKELSTKQNALLDALRTQGILLP